MKTPEGTKVTPDYWNEKAKEPEPNYWDLEKKPHWEMEKEEREKAAKEATEAKAEAVKADEVIEKKEN